MVIEMFDATIFLAVVAGFIAGAASAALMSRMSIREDYDAAFSHGYQKGVRDGYRELERISPGANFDVVFDDEGSYTLKEKTK